MASGLRQEQRKRALRVLLVEDCEPDAELVVDELKRGGYDVVWERVQTAAAMQTALQHATWDIVLSDFDLPTFSGPAALALLQASNRDLPFLIISGTIGEETAVDALKAGAGDFLIKGRLSRLVPAIERELRDAAVRRERARAQEALRQSEAQYRSLVERAVFGIFRATVDGRLLTVNPALVSMLRYGSAEELLAVNLYDIHVDRSVRDALVQRARHFGNVTGVETMWHPKVGKPIRVRISGSVIEGADTTAPVLEQIVEDITERVRLEEELRQAQKMEAIGQLAGGIAHDFNNLLTAILGYAKLLSDALESGDVNRRDVDEIARAAERAAGLTRQLLAFSRRQVLKPTVIDVNALVTNTGQMLRRLIGEHIDLVTALGADLAPVRADVTQLEQIVMNLAVNARDAMPSGGRLTIKTANLDLDESFATPTEAVRPGRYVMVAVSDTGIGMTEETRQRLFEPFFTTKEQGKGTGLGLATVYGIVRQSNGYIRVDSQPQQGATFTVYLPAVEGAAVAESQSPAPSEDRRGSEAILLVEDERAVRLLTRIILERAGYRVFEADTPEQAEKLFAAHAAEIDLLMTDVVMPGSNGPALFRRLAVDRPSLKVLFMSGYTDQAVVDAGHLDAGAHFLEKPFTAGGVTRKVREVLDRSGG